MDKSSIDKKKFSNKNLSNETTIQKHRYNAIVGFSPTISMKEEYGSAIKIEKKIILSFNIILFLEFLNLFFFMIETLPSPIGN